MILNPAIMALVLGSLMICGYAAYAGTVGVEIIRHWDLASGSERQLRLERKTYLVSTILAYIMGFEIFSLFLFAYTADDLHGVFTGAMCAAGSLNVNAYGYPVLVVKIANFILCGNWLVLNYVDSRAWDYPLIRVKYKYLLVLAGLLVLETYLLFGYFRNLRPNVITSCCGTLFSQEARSVAGLMAGISPYYAKIIFYLSVVLMLRAGGHFLVTGRAARVFSLFSIWLLIFAFVAVISFISLYYYELPTHHCPFCLLQKEYAFVGYPLYLSLLSAGITGSAVGLIDRLKDRQSLKEAVPMLQRRLCLISISSYLVFTIISTYPMIFSDFKLEGY